MSNARATILSTIIYKGYFYPRDPCLDIHHIGDTSLENTPTSDKMLSLTINPNSPLVK